MSLREKLGGFNADLSLDRAKTIPSHWYTDEEIYQLERRAVFHNNWQYVTRSGLVKDPGQYATWDVAGEPVLIARDRESTLRAYSNVCRHRAARVAPAPCGTASYFQCRYHGWTYDLRGRLKGAPEFDGVADFFKEENGLPEWRVDSFGDFVFVHAGRPQSSLSDFLSPLPERTQSYGFDSLKFVARKEYELKCNWKVFVDNYLDGGYHVNTVHPSLGGLIQYSDYRTEIARFTSVQISPLKSNPKDLAAAAVRQGDCAYYWWVYPNLMMNLYQGVMDINVVYPLAVDRCLVIFDFYFADTESESAKQKIATSLELAHKIQVEDLEICEEVQRNLGSRSYDTGRFSIRREAGGHHFHSMLSQQLHETAF